MTSEYCDISGVLIKIEEIIGEFEISPMNEFLPFHRFNIKLVKRSNGEYQATPNVCVRNAVTGDYEYTAGFAKSPESALENAIRNFFEEVKKQSQVRELNEQDFVFNVLGYYYPGCS